MMQYRQGDVLVESATIPKDATRVQTKDRLVLAEGEATGHAHAIEVPADVELLEHDGTLYLRVRAEAIVKHEEHGPITLAPGEYRVTRQREYSPEEIRRVAD